MIRVASSAHRQHGLDRRLYESLESRVEACGIWDAEEIASSGIDVFHMHWPEWFVAGRPLRWHRQFIGDLRSAGVRILSTQHNLSPHSPSTEGVAIYREWAASADAVVHHSFWGFCEAGNQLPYAAKASHTVIPLAYPLITNRSGRSREAIESAFGFEHDVTRLAVLGAPRPEKDVKSVVTSVLAGARSDLELVSNSLGPEEPPLWNRHAKLWPYEFMADEVYADYLSIIDYVVYPFRAGRMLTSATPIDAIGMGIAGITSEWPFLNESLPVGSRRYLMHDDSLAQLLPLLNSADSQALGAATATLRPKHDPAWVAERYYSVILELVRGR